MRATESIWKSEPRQRRKVRPHIQAAARRTMLWALLGVLLLGTAAGICLTMLGDRAALTPYSIR
ncbi:hypothetical protein C0214_06135 [Methylobacterium sp. DM1]|uniref:Uncharacterized protein n=3 Tax=Methylorubrum extorquens TaxID=408 RepID=C5B3I9_METEA|nr:hypothetical protein MexAM1_META2p0091 [Methylorubrum extorquens AM1]AWI87910.1 hypothetical protein C0214_06135 [Methylobacterium sp. DM1]MBD8905336.1 hypothetical protein [Methylorubrum zatmanii]GEL41084.1 hypothetical protein MEX01_16750 [Methylorubrum extorquens]CAX22939.1 protein of unknown function [Methylorubrum extorquens DM4]